MRLAFCLPLLFCTFSFAQSGLDRAGCAPARGNHENLNAVLWVRTSLEYRHSATQAFRLAELQLERALADRTWTAALEQNGGYEALPPAVILDVDETVLDNSPAQAQFMSSPDGLYSEADWDTWVKKAAAEPVPGARDFLQFAAARGVEAFYVTNREQKHHDDTLRNLREKGFPFADDAHLLTKGETPGWGSDKASRRRFISSTHRVLLLIGDDANDFLSGVRGDRETRDAAFAPYQQHLGTKWIALPNPTYGSWENALWGGGYAKSREQSLQAKCAELP